MDNISVMLDECILSFAIAHDLAIFQDVDIFELKIKILMEKEHECVRISIPYDNSHHEVDRETINSILADMYALLQAKIARRNAE